MPVNYLYSVPKDLAEEVMVRGIVDEHTHINRRFCKCGAKDWGWGLHATSCPIHQYYVYGGLYAKIVLLSILDGYFSNKQEADDAS